METHFLRMYLSHTYDVLSGVTKSFCYSPALNEIANAIQMVPSFEKNSITLYDRLYLSTDIIKTHLQSDNFFIARCKGGGTFSIIMSLMNGPGWYSRMVIEGVEVHLYKYRNSKTKEVSILATNLPHGTFSKKDMVSLYSRRWEVETTFRDFTSTMKMEQWHSNNYNGILQELYAHFWLFNYTKIQMVLSEPEKSSEELVRREYSKSNFKLILSFVVESMPRLIKGLYQQFCGQVQMLMKRTRQRRKHFKRQYPRTIKKAQSPFKSSSLVSRVKSSMA